MTTKVYIAGPYSSNPVGNTHTAIWWMNKLLDEGFAPFCPHLTHYAEEKHARPYEDWLAYDLHWLKPCDVLLRITGASAGADKEVAYAIEHGIPVVYESEYMHGEFLHTDVDLTVAMIKDAVATAAFERVKPAAPTPLVEQKGYASKPAELPPNPALERPGSCLDEAKSIVYGDRNHDYGNPGDNHATTADMFRAYLKRRYGVDLALDGRAICQFNILQKVSRDAHCPKRDNLVDMQGYAENAQMCTDHVPAETPHFTG